MRQRWFGIIGFVIAVSSAALLVLPEECRDWFKSSTPYENTVSRLEERDQPIEEYDVDSRANVQLTTYVSPDNFGNDRYPADSISITPRNRLTGKTQTSKPSGNDIDRQASKTHTPHNNPQLTRQLLDSAGLSVDDQQLLKELPSSCLTGLPEYIENPQPDIFQQTIKNPLPTNLVNSTHQTTWQSEQSSVATSPAPNSTNRQTTPDVNPSFQRISNQDAKGGAYHNHQPQHVRGHSSAQNQTIKGAVKNQIDLVGFNPHKNASASGATVNPNVDCDVDPHLELYTKSRFPSAVECAQCHKQIFDEWASSSHAYAAVSPMFHRFEDTINRLSQGTIGYFCMRCHAPIATTVGLRRDQPIWDGPRVFREGVTCIVCHRVKEQLTKANGERRVEEDPLEGPIYAGGDGKGVELAAYKYNAFYKTKTDPNEPGPGQLIHRRTIQFQQLSQSDYCMSCHQVAVQPGIKLEVVWDQYRASPAYKQGVTCQDCHMGKVPGVDSGYPYGPAAVVSNRVVNPERKHSNHAFYGPGYSIAHPGIFPQNPDADRWTFNQWLQFDWRAGWGTDEFEDKVAEGLINAYFPPCWTEVDDRYDAREIVEDNLKKLHYKKDLRRQVMENGSKIDGPFFAGLPITGEPLKFHYCVTNTNPGHNMPSGSLGAQPQLWLNVVLIGPDGRRVWESGYLDSNGDLADLHSLDVLARRVPHDDQLFNLQTKFLTTNVKGTDREMYLPINLDIDQLPFLRPAPQPVSVLNHPPLIRMEAHSLPPLGSRKAKYIVPAGLMCEPGTYRLSVRLRSRAEPIYFMKFVKSTPEMERMMNEWIVDAHAYTVVFEVK